PRPATEAHNGNAVHGPRIHVGDLPRNQRRDQVAAVGGLVLGNRREVIRARQDRRVVHGRDRDVGSGGGRAGGGGPAAGGRIDLGPLGAAGLVPGAERDGAAGRVLAVGHQPQLVGRAQQEGRVGGHRADRVPGAAVVGRILPGPRAATEAADRNAVHGPRIHVGDFPGNQRRDQVAAVGGLVLG